LTDTTKLGATIQSAERLLGLARACQQNAAELYACATTDDERQHYFAAKARLANVVDCAERAWNALRRTLPPLPKDAQHKAVEER
jgi:hypothetical protein